MPRYRRWASHRAWRWWAQGNESALPQLISAAPEELREYEGFPNQVPLDVPFKVGGADTVKALMEP